LNHSIEYYRTCRRKAVELSDTGLMTVLSRLHEQPENLESVPVTTSANGWYRVTIEPDTTRRDSMQIHLETIGHYGMVTHKKKYRFRMTITENETVWVQTYVE